MTIEEDVWYKQTYTGMLMKYAKFDTMIEDEAQKALMEYLAERRLDIEDYEVEVTYRLRPKLRWGDR